jgi:tRNA-specific 2-thiouridylase
VIVGPKSALATSRLMLRDVNWLGDGPLEALGEPLDILTKVRSTAAPVAARLVASSAATAEVELAEGEDGIAPGQACVFYTKDGQRVLGGGFIAGTRMDVAAEGISATARSAAE